MSNVSHSWHNCNFCLVTEGWQNLTMRSYLWKARVLIRPCASHQEVLWLPLHQWFYTTSYMPKECCPELYGLKLLLGKPDAHWCAMMNPRLKQIPMHKNGFCLQRICPQLAHCQRLLPEQHHWPTMFHALTISRTTIVFCSWPCSSG